MTESFEQRIEEILDHGYDFTAGQYIRRGYEIFKSNAGAFIGFLLLMILIGVFAQVIPVIGSIAWSLFLAPALTVGFYIVANKISRGEHTEFNNFFKGFEHVGQLALYTLVLTLIVLAVFSPVIVMGLNSGLVQWYMDLLQNPMNPPTELPNIPGSLGLVSLLLMVPLIYIAVSYTFAPLYIVFYRMGFWDAMETSRKVVSKQWFSVFGLYLRIFGIVLLATIAGSLISGLFFSISGFLGAIAVLALVALIFIIGPVIYCAIFSAFEDVMQMNKEGADDELIDHLVD